jgi:hypothetical protein
MAKDPDGFFIQRDNKKCFLRNNEITRKEDKKLTVFDTLRYLENIPPLQSY